MATLTKNWDRHVVHAEDIARGCGFRDLRDAIVERAAPKADDRVLDVGAGTGLLTLALAHDVARVWALDISPAMCAYLRAKSASAGATNVECVEGSAISLPLVDESIDLVVSNYCFHHLNAPDKKRALEEVKRVLLPGGRLVLGDMMFAVSLTDARDRDVVATKVKAILRKGPAGVLRLVRNAARLALARWDKPARAGWWVEALVEAGFVDVSVETLAHEGGIAAARKPTSLSPSIDLAA